MNLDNIILRNFPIITDEYKKFAKEKDACRKCDIYKNHKVVTQAEGNAQNPTFVFVGECPGSDEVEQNRPFIGSEGQRLRAELRKHSEFRKDTVLLTNTLCCRPPGNLFPKNPHGRRKVSACVDMWLTREIELLKPQIIVMLGNVALEYVTGDRGITANRGAWKFLYQYKAWSMATFHPSYVISQQQAGEKHIVDQFEHDIKKIADTWSTLVDIDYRMLLEGEEWAEHAAITTAKEMGLLKAPYKYG